MVRAKSVYSAILDAEWKLGYEGIEISRREIVHAISYAMRTAQFRAKRTFETAERERFVRIAKKMYGIE